jgi:protein-tyrosine-phosphatase
MLPEAIVESAGWSPQDALAPKAVSVVKEMTGRDISAQRPRGVDEVDLAQFDLVVGLEPRVAEELIFPPSDGDGLGCSRSVRGHAR